MTQGFDASKDAANRAKHGVGFEEVEELDWRTAITSPDRRKDYGETRWVTFAMLHGRLHCLIWTWRSGALRPISFRRANLRERTFYDTQTN